MADEDSSSIEFRTFHPRRAGTGEKGSDACKTVVKIEQRYMQNLGIRKGDVVKVSGNTKSTAAVCLPTEPGELEEIAAMSPDPEVEYLNNPEKKMQFPPRAIIYGPISCNVDQTMDLHRTVTISKFPESQGSVENVCDAQTVTLATLDLAEKMMPGYQNNLDYGEIRDFTISKGDRINIPFQEQWLEEKKKEMQQRQGSDQPNAMRPNRPRRPKSFFPRTFQSVVLAARPEGKVFWRITGDTKFEFEGAGTEVFGMPRYSPQNLVNVIPVSKQLSVDDTKFTIPSLEVYSDRMRLVWYSHQRIKIPESVFGDPQKIEKINDMVRMTHGPRPVIEIRDDLGNRYSASYEGGGGGGSGPDPITMEIVSDFSCDLSFSPSLDSNAKEVVITIKEIRWLRRKRNAHGMEPPPPPTTETAFMTPMEPRYIPKMVIAEGPWEYRIPVSPPPR